MNCNFQETKLTAEKEKNSCLQKAYSYLSRRIRTEKELRRYLKEKGYSTEDIDICIRQLKAEKLIDDASYTVEYIIYSMNKNRGRRRIVEELKEKGVSGNDIEDGFLAYEEEFGSMENQEEKVLEAAEKYFMSREFIEKNIAAFARKMQRQGFEYREIIGAVNKIKNKTESHRGHIEV